MVQDNGVSALPTGLSQAEPEVSALRASIPDAKWPMWGAAVAHERFREGMLETVIALCFLRAPDEEAARKGAITMQRQKNEDGLNFQAIVAVVPNPISDTPNA